MVRKRIVFHIDVNSAYLSWEAAYRIQHGEKEDIRQLPTVIGGDPEKRRGIVLAKSQSAKAMGIKTGESLFAAFKKCPNLKVIRPNYNLYIKSSRAFVELLKEYSQNVQRYSIDECFIDFTGYDRLWGSAFETACEMKDRIKNELGFTVSIGISSNKLLAKVASELKKPDGVTVLFPEDMPEKMWPLPIDELFGVGPATAKKLRRIGIITVGNLANTDPEFLKYKFGKYGQLIWNYANGIEESMIGEKDGSGIKGIGNSSTLPRDVDNKESAYLYILSLTEMVAMRLRDSGFLCGLVSISIRSNELDRASHQKRLVYSTNSTMEIFEEAKALFDALWDERPIRHIGVRVSKLVSAKERQLPIFAPEKIEKLEQLDETIDKLRLKYGNQIVCRGSLLHTGVKAVMGGVGEEDYPMMQSQL